MLWQFLNIMMQFVVQKESMLLLIMQNDCRWAMQRCNLVWYPTITYDYWHCKVLCECLILSSCTSLAEKVVSSLLGFLADLRSSTRQGNPVTNFQQAVYNIDHFLYLVYILYSMYSLLYVTEEESYYKLFFLVWWKVIW